MTKHFEYLADYLRLAVWRDVVARGLTVGGFLTFIVGGSVIAILAPIGRHSFYAGIGISLFLLVVFLYGGFIAYRNERRTSQSLGMALRHKLSGQLRVLKQAIGDGNALVGKIRALEMNWDPSYLARIKSWTDAVDVFLSNQLPEWSERFWQESGGRELPQPNACFEVQDQGNFMERRLVQLHGMADELIPRQEWYGPKAS